MSKWYGIKDRNDVSLSDDGKELYILFDGDDEGNIWVSVPVELLPVELINLIKSK